MKTVDGYRKHGISHAPLHWKARYGGVTASLASRSRPAERRAIAPHPSMITASLRATATFAFLSKLRLVMDTPPNASGPSTGRAAEHRVGSREEGRSREPMPGLDDPAPSINSARSMLSRRQFQMSVDIA